MAIEIVLLLCTGVLTVLALLSTKRSVALRDEAAAMVHALRRQSLQHELIVEEFEAIKKRQAKLAGRFFREKRGAILEGELADPAPPRDPVTHDFVNGHADSDVDDLIALQNAHNRAEQREV